MDDVTVSGPEAQVAGDIETIRSKGGEIGLHLNKMKGELIRKDGRSSNPVFQSFLHLETTVATLLGAPLTNGRSMDTALHSRCDDLSRSIERLGLVSAHDALLLLRASFSAPKLMHTLRSSPSYARQI